MVIPWTRQTQYFFDFYKDDGFVIVQKYPGSTNEEPSQGILASDSLSCDKDTPMWISWKDGQLRIGHGDIYGDDTLMKVQDITGMADHIYQMTLANPYSIQFTIRLIDSK